MPCFVSFDPKKSAFQISATPKIQTLPCSTAVTWVASLTHMTFVGSVMIGADARC
ncbi:hypothetical protein ACLF3G_28675 [Falsiroseomonas sp. HC035]|uniref:hypothetical protein n=1 Tax=Falsiroseomonas sp. HC035 TaxID=3390999 RepID=UPI003D315470